MKKIFMLLLFVIYSQLALANDKTIKIVIPQSSSSGLAQIYAHLEKFAAKKSISTIPVFKPGAAGTIGMNYAIKEQKNNILLLSTISDYVNANGDKNFRSISAINEIELTLVASKKSNIKTIQDLVSIEKSNPGKLNWAQTSSATGEFINQLAKIHNIDKDKILRIQYKDPRVSDIVNGDIDVAFILTSVAKSLAERQRITIVEIDDVTRLRMAEKKNASALFAPINANQETISFWQSVINDFLKDPDIIEIFRKSNIRSFEKADSEKLDEIISNWKNI